MMRNDLVKTPIFSMLLRMSIPMSWGILSVIGFNLADIYFIAKLGKVHLAAISLTFPIVMLFISLALGVATAVSSIVSRSLGENSSRLVRRYTTDGLSFALLLVIVLSSIGFLTIDFSLSLLGASESTLPLAKEYLKIWYSGMIFITVPIAGNGAIRARGDMKIASLIMITAAITNVILDPIFIFGYFGVPAMGMKGAAYATVIARAITLFASIGVLHFKYKMLDFSKAKAIDIVNSWREILYIAIPSAGANIIKPIALFIVTSVVARFGETSVAVFGVVSKLESFAMIFIMAISSSMGPIVGQNFGAKKSKRIQNALSTSFVIALSWGVVMAILLSQFGKLILPLFNSDPSLVGLGEKYFYIVPITFGFFGIRLITTTSFNAVGKPFVSTGLILFTLLIIYLPGVFLGAHYLGLAGVFYAQAVSNIFSGILCFVIVRKYLLAD